MGKQKQPFLVNLKKETSDEKLGALVVGKEGEKRAEEQKSFSESLLLGASVSGITVFIPGFG